MIGDAVTAVRRRWRRNLLSALALAIGSATVASIMSISLSSATEVLRRLGTFDSQTVTVGLPGSAWAIEENRLLENLEASSSVLSAGTVVAAEGGTQGVEVKSPQFGTRASASLTIATQEGMSSRGIVLTSGAITSPSVVAADPSYALLGARLARELDINPALTEPTVLVNGVPLMITGIVADSEQGGLASTTIVLAPEVAERMGLLPATRVVNVQVDAGQASAMAGYLATALYTRDPKAVSVQYSPSPDSLRRDLTRTSDQMVTFVALVTLATSIFSIITTFQIAVMERRREIGLARALGSTQLRVMGTFLCEAAIIAVAGSTAGFLAGVVIAGVVSTWTGWLFVVPPILFSIPVIGALTGMIAGSVPAYTASRTDPASLLRS